MIARPLPVVSGAGRLRVRQVAPGPDGQIRHGVRNHDARLGSVALDLVDSVFDRKGICVDRIDGPQAWALWLAEVGFVAPRVGIDADTLSRVRVLREAICQTALAVIGVEPSSSDALTTLNTFAERAQPGFGIEMLPAGGFVVRRSEQSHDDLLASIARDAVMLFTGSGVDRIRVCDWHSCPAIFYDNSPAGDRRWCSPQCGARAAAQSYRDRQRARLLAQA
ncbi:MAG: ABATE domain-containing protein [Microbacterium sp.]|uniref:CGNR zinc finger domain-containing protein n=1 Tax=Microbacterium sp. TaxID=51671 RepID=UPI0039E24314